MYKPTKPSGAAIRNGTRQPQACICASSSQKPMPNTSPAAQANAMKVETGTRLP